MIGAPTQLQATRQALLTSVSRAQSSFPIPAKKSRFYLPFDKRFFHALERNINSAGMAVSTKREIVREALENTKAELLECRSQKDTETVLTSVGGLFVGMGVVAAVEFLAVPLLNKFLGLNIPHDSIFKANPNPSMLKMSLDIVLLFGSAIQFYLLVLKIIRKSENSLREIFESASEYVTKRLARDFPQEFSN